MKATRPSASVIVSVTGKVPSLVNVCVAVSPLADPPSPKSHWKDATCAVALAPDASTTVAVKTTVSLTFGLGTVKLGLRGLDGRTIVPAGTSSMLTERGVAFAKSEPLGVTRILIVVVDVRPATAFGAV